MMLVRTAEIGRSNFQRFMAVLVKQHSLIPPAKMD